MKFEIYDDQLVKLKEWKESIKVIFGEYGLFTYKFTPNGIGVSVEVYSVLADISLNLTEVDKW